MSLTFDYIDFPSYHHTTCDSRIVVTPAEMSERFNVYHQNETHSQTNLQYIIPLVLYSEHIDHNISRRHV